MKTSFFLQRKSFSSPLFFGVMYLSLIPFFALIFTFFLPDHFALTNLKREKGFETERKILAEQLAYSMLDLVKYTESKLRYGNATWHYFGRTGGMDTLVPLREKELASFYRENNGLVYGPYEVSGIKDISLRDEDLEFVLMMTLDSAHSGPLSLLEHRCTQRKDWIDCTNKLIPSTYPGIDELGIECVRGAFDPTRCNTYSFWLEALDDPRHVELSERYKELRSAFLLFHSDTQFLPTIDTYFRMLYFSTVTITTLGYGDILPISNLARIMVSIESIVGIVVIGLFLNAVGRK